MSWPRTCMDISLSSFKDGENDDEEPLLGDQPSLWNAETAAYDASPRDSAEIVILLLNDFGGESP